MKRFKEYIQELKSPNEIDIGISIKDLGKTSKELSKLSVKAGLYLHKYLPSGQKWSKEHGELDMKSDGSLYIKVKPNGKKRIKINNKTQDELDKYIDNIKQAFLKAVKH